MSNPGFLFLVLVFLLNKDQVYAHRDHHNNFRKFGEDILLTIENPNGDIVDCIAKPSSFPNRLLKDDMIQSGFEKWSEAFMNETQSSFKKVSQILFNNATRCPEGSVPILQTKLKNVTTTSPVFLRKKRRTLNRHLVNTPERGGHGDNDEDETVIVSIWLDDGIKGIQARINVWHPTIESDDELTSSHIWLNGQDDNDGANTLNVIGAGWHVDPSVTHDKQTRLFGYWTRDGSTHTGGYNFEREGFQPVHNQVYLGFPLDPSSIYDGDQQDMLVTIHKGQHPNGTNDACWWLAIGEDEAEIPIPIGYWPIEIFTQLKDGLATRVDLIGHVKNLRTKHENHRHTKTKMGSGHFADKHYPRASYFSNIRVMNANGGILSVSEDELYTEVTSVNCYTVETLQDSYLGTGFYYGGPGYDENQPDHCP